MSEIFDLLFLTQVEKDILLDALGGAIERYAALSLKCVNVDTMDLYRKLRDDAQRLWIRINKMEVCDA